MSARNAFLFIFTRLLSASFCYYYILSPFTLHLSSFTIQRKKLEPNSYKDARKDQIHVFELKG